MEGRTKAPITHGHRTALDELKRAVEERFATVHARNDHTLEQEGNKK